MTIPWRDVFPAMTTQFRRDESLDLDATGRHIERMIASGASGIVMLGSLGAKLTLASGTASELDEVEKEARSLGTEV